MTVILDEELQGKNLKDTFRYLNIRVKNEESADLLPDSLENLTPLQKVYVTSVANKQQDPLAIIEQLKCNDIAIVKRALKADWFFRGTLPLDVNFLVDEVFPTVSFGTMCKIISRFGALLESESLAEELYAKVNHACGAKLAVKLLPRCSEKFIHSIINEKGFSLEEIMLLKLYKRHQKLAIDYLKSYFNREKSHQLRHIDTLTLLANDQLEVFMDLFNQHSFSLRLGYRTSVKVLEKYRCDIVKDFPKFRYILNTEAVVELVKGEDFEKIFLQMLPEKSDYFYYGDYTAYLCKMKPTFRAEFITRMYTTKYKGKSLYDDSSFERLPILNDMPKQARIQWAECRIEQYVPSGNRGVDFYWKYLDAPVSIPFYKQLLNTASGVNDRISILKSMIECCLINRDNETLVEVMQFVSKRYRNDLEVLRYQFLNEVKSKFNLSELSENHWIVIDEMLEVMYLNDDIKNNNRSQFLSDIIEQQIKFMLGKGLNIEDKIDKLLEYDVDIFPLAMNIKKHTDVIFEICIAKYKKILNSEQDCDKRENLICKILGAFDDYNSTHDKKRSISDQEFIIAELDNVLKTNRSKQMIDRISSILKKDVTLKNRYINELYKYSLDEYLVKSLFKHNIEYLEKNLSQFAEKKITKVEMKAYARIFNRMRTYASKSLGEKLIKELNLKLANTTSEESDASMVIELSNLMDIKDANILLKKYVPNETKVDIKTVNRKEHQDSKDISEQLKYINPPVDQELLLSFAKDDYLQHVIPSLLSSISKYPNVESQTLIAHLAQQPVSLKKHSIRLAYHMCPPRTLPSFYKRFWDSEKNISIREIIFARTMKLFTRNQFKEIRKEAWDTLKYFMNNINDDLVNVSSYLADIQSVDTEFVSEFCELSWKILKKLPKSKQIVVKSISEYVCRLMSVSEHLSDDFSEQIFSDYINSDPGNEQCDLQPFVVQFIMKAKSVEAQHKRTGEICQQMKRTIETSWDTTHKERDRHFVIRSKINSLVEKCCEYAVLYDLQINPQFILDKLSETILAALPDGPAFNLTLSINLSKEYNTMLEDEMFCDVKKSQLSSLDLKKSDQKEMFEKVFQKFGYQIGNMWRKVSSQYGLIVESLFEKSITQFSYCFGDYSFVKKNLFKGVIANAKSDNNRACFYLALELIPDEYHLEDTEKINDYIKEVIDSGDIVLKMLCDDKYQLKRSFLYGA